MNLPEIAIKRPVFAWMMMWALILFGGIAYTRLGVSQFPDVDFPTINIQLRLNNAAPELMESTVVRVIEDAIMSTEGLKSVSASVSPGLANITCEFNLNRKINVALNEVQNRISEVANRLPKDLYPPVVTKTNPEDRPILWVILTANKSIAPAQQMIFAQDTLKGQFSILEGVGNIELAGFVEPNLRVWLDRDKLYDAFLTAGDVIDNVEKGHVERPAGRIEAPANDISVRVLGEAKSTAEFGSISLNLRAGSPNHRPVPLNSVSRIEEGLEDAHALSRFNGRPAVGLGIVKQHGANAVDVAQLVEATVAKLRTRLPAGYDLQVQLDSTKFIRSSIHELILTLLYSAILTAITCYFFLGSWSSTANVLIAIPTSVIGTFLAFYFLGFTLNSFTLLGLCLAVGLIVDDAIMMLENIVRHRDLGKSRLEAARAGASEISFAVIATSLALVAIFVPVIFMDGLIGKYFYQYGIAVTVAIALSLLEALTLTPMRCSKYLSEASHQVRGLSGRVHVALESFTAWYRQTLAWALARRNAVLVASLLLFVASLGLLFAINKELSPPQDQAYFLLVIKAKPGTPIRTTDQLIAKAEATLRKDPAVKDLYAQIGNYQNNDTVNVGTIQVVLKEPSARKLNQQQVMDHTRSVVSKLLPEAEVFVQDLSLAGFSSSRGFPIEFTVEGADWDQLQSSTETLLRELRATGIVTDLNSDSALGMPELQLTPNRERATERGLNFVDIGKEVAILGGENFAPTSRYPFRDHRFDIRLKFKADPNDTFVDVGNVKLRNNRGGMVPLKEVVDAKVLSVPQVITRRNRARAIPVYANVTRGRSLMDAIDVVKKTARRVLPPGEQIVMSGSAESFHDAFAGLIFAMALGLTISYMVLASQFESFSQPIAVLMTLPFSASGALVAIFLMNQSLNLFSLMGFILLMGIAKKNSILLVDLTNQLRADGKSVDASLLEACPIRLRPILMTSFATIAGALPAAINFGAGAETRAPMASVVVGGVLLSTVLTLYVVPCAYAMLTELEVRRWIPNRLRTNH